MSSLITTWQLALKTPLRPTQTPFVMTVKVTLDVLGKYESWVKAVEARVVAVIVVSFITWHSEA